MKPADLHDFVGHWSLRRDIDDRRAGQAAIATGQAVLSPGPQGLVYDEEIILQLPGQKPLEGRRRYLWRAVTDGIAVCFDDGRSFHTIALGTAAPDDAHWCDPDHYEVTYDFAGWPCWRSVWTVSGPRKSYRMETAYAPLTVT
ncbi:DUF6314 family protein [Puniceibacterium sediminis]|uniref:DUF6314 domain-containing protein n=1 Tax=Puniceibacterium sediminis TaxID=1608407 RepID=A0A238V0V3_9RHOB|nr:DUF6314 family protein [Puniceibacterium sediminis]SNR27173.1 hypothetical protein SAMN06265370_101341 [Puniceibacterium sediminis]